MGFERMAKRNFGIDPVGIAAAVLCFFKGTGSDKLRDDFLHSRIPYGAHSRGCIFHCATISSFRHPNAAGLAALYGSVSSVTFLAAITLATRQHTPPEPFLPVLVSIMEWVVLGAIAASASYIDAPAAVRHALPTANPSIYLNASLGITFPFNLLVGLPLYYQYAVWIYA